MLLPTGHAVTTSMLLSATISMLLSTVHSVLIIVGIRENFVQPPLELVYKVTAVQAAAVRFSPTILDYRRGFRASEPCPSAYNSSGSAAFPCSVCGHNQGLPFA